ncbi:hypothetical protein ACIPC1_15045 [Streptomyces sp. NPDC087263]|uniref:hypothetical protein n=1 Tax=Streptomyces sp. NPDC087263 TaxID=3365773 RepID=UPI0037FBECFE
MTMTMTMTMTTATANVTSANVTSARPAAPAEYRPDGRTAGRGGACHGPAISEAADTQDGPRVTLPDDAARSAGRPTEHDVHVELQVSPQVPHVLRALLAPLGETTAARRTVTFTREHWAAMPDASGDALSGGAP